MQHLSNLSHCLMLVTNSFWPSGENVRLTCKNRYYIVRLSNALYLNIDELGWEMAAIGYQENTFASLFACKNNWRLWHINFANEFRKRRIKDNSNDKEQSDKERFWTLWVKYSYLPLLNVVPKWQTFQSWEIWIFLDNK